MKEPMPFYVMALGNFGGALWVLSQITQARGDLGAVYAFFCLIGAAIFLVSSIATASLSWGIAKSKRYWTRLLLALGLTLAPWLLFAIFIFQ